jgi:hypothetical protein
MRLKHKKVSKKVVCTYGSKTDARRNATEMVSTVFSTNHHMKNPGTPKNFGMTDFKPW